MDAPIWVYVSGPLTVGNQSANVRNAVKLALALLGEGLVPICPHLSVLADMIEPRSYETWMEWDLALLERCDALVRMPGESPGADREVARAKELHKPVFLVGAFAHLAPWQLRLEIEEAVEWQRWQTKR